TRNGGDAPTPGRDRPCVRVELQRANKCLNSLCVKALRRTMVTRRDIALGAIVLAATIGTGLGALKWRGRANAAAETFEVTHTPAECTKLLTPEKYAGLREEDTERPFTSPLNKEHRKGTFTCAGCNLPLFASDTKFDSGTGWPSFYAPIDGAVNTNTDHTFG